LDETVDAIKRVQTLLGEVHDCDVWVEHLQTFAAKERGRMVKRYGHAGPFARLEVGLDYLRGQRQQRREQVFRELVEYWQELKRRGHWERLVETVRRPGSQPAVPEPAVQANPTPSSARKTEGDL
jgi:hypothetical protein